MKHCMTCKDTDESQLSLNSTMKNKNGKTYYTYICHPCRRAKYHDRKQRAQNQEVEIDEMRLKYCGKCKTTKHLFEFNKDNRSSDKRASHCRKCRNAANVLYRKTHPLTPEQKARMEEQKKAWVVANKERYYTRKNAMKRRQRERKRVALQYA